MLSWIAEHDGTLILVLFTLGLLCAPWPWQKAPKRRAMGCLFFVLAFVVLIIGTRSCGMHGLY